MRGSFGARKQRESGVGGGGEWEVSAIEFHGKVSKSPDPPIESGEQ